MRLLTRFSLIWIVSLCVLVLGLSSAVIAQCKGDRTLIAIGGGYGDTFDGFIATALDNIQGDTLRIVVLPSAYATNADAISDEERQENLDAAENRRAQLEEACIAGVPESLSCEVALAPVFTHADALDAANLRFFTQDVAAVYILGGDQTVAMRVLNGTPIEEALTNAYDCGVVIAGTSAGEAIQSRVMIAGYIGDFGPEAGLKEGAVEVWRGEERGLPFGLDNAILEQHFWERGRIGRLLNVLAQPDVPHVGIGVDGYTAVEISDGRTLHNVFGLYSVGILDAETLDAAASATFKDGSLSMRNVLFHIMPPGDFEYDLDRRESSIATTLTDPDRSFDTLRAPEGAGTLILASHLVGEDMAANPILTRFVETSGGQDAFILVILMQSNTPSTNELMAVREAYLSALGVRDVYVTAVTGEDTSLPLPPTFEDRNEAADFDGILVVGGSQSILNVDALAPVRDAWLSGKPLLLDNAAAALAGAFYAAHPPIPEATDDEPYADVDAIQGAFIDGATSIQPGLGLLNLMVEPRVLGDYRVGRLVALAYAHPDLLALGLSDGGALEITAGGATVLGDNGLIVLDLGGATLDKGANEAYAFANGLLDVFAPGENIAIE